MSVRALKSGAVEFLTKPFRDQDLLDAIQQALQRDRAAREQLAEVSDLRERYHALTAREREVMTLVISGMLNKHIAAKIGASEATVKIHRGSRHGEDASRIVDRTSPHGRQTQPPAQIVIGSIPTVPRTNYSNLG